MLTSRTLCPAVGARPERPSLLAAAAAAAMPVCPTLREARAPGIPGMDRPVMHTQTQSESFAPHADGKLRARLHWLISAQYGLLVFTRALQACKLTIEYLL